MKVTSIEFRTHEYDGLEKSHFTVSLDQVSPSHSYILKSAVGLDPDEILNLFYGNVSVSKSRYTPAERFYDMKPAPKTVSFRIKLDPNYNEGETPSSLRDALYKMIAYHRGGKIRMWFYDGETAEVELVGFVTRFESNLFTNDPEVQITLKCIDPFFRGIERVVLLGGMDPVLIEINDDPSTAPHGLDVNIEIVGDTDRITFKGIAGEETADFRIDHDFINGDKVYLRTDPLDRQVYLTKPPFHILPEVYLMDKVVLGSVWPMMFPDQNRFQVTSNDGTVEVEVLAYTKTYWGI